jgi:hypothetical protein
MGSAPSRRKTNFKEVLPLPHEPNGGASAENPMASSGTKDGQACIQPGLEAANVTIHSFFANPSAYQRVHIHLVGARPIKDDGSAAKSRSGFEGTFDKIAKLFDTPDPFVVCKAVGDDTGSVDSFAVGTETFPVLPNCALPMWDKKGVIVCKISGTAGVQFQMRDKDVLKTDSVLIDFTLSRNDLPSAGSGWADFARRSDSGKAEANMELVFRIKVTRGDKRMRGADAEALASCFTCTESLAYAEQEIVCGDHRSLLMSWKHKAGSKKAALWLPGRNDCFMVRPYLDLGGGVVSTFQFMGIFSIYEDKVKSAVL